MKRSLQSLFYDQEYPDFFFFCYPDFRWDNCLRPRHRDSPCCHHRSLRRRQCGRFGGRWRWHRLGNWRTPQSQSLRIRCLGLWSPGSTCWCPDRLPLPIQLHNHKGEVLGRYNTKGSHENAEDTETLHRQRGYRGTITWRWRQSGEGEGFRGFRTILPNWWLTHTSRTSHSADSQLTFKILALIPTRSKIRDQRSEIRALWSC